MKTINKTLLLLFSCILFFSSCYEKKNTENLKDRSELSCYPNNERPSIAITYNEMSQMMVAHEEGAKIVLDNYMKEVSKEISNGKDSISTKSYWYKLEDLKQYIAYLEKISGDKNIPLTGIKIYPAAYPKNHENKKYRGRQTLIFVPTTKIGDSDNDVAFEPLKSTKGNPISMMDYLEKYRNKTKVSKASFISTTMFLDEEISSAGNRGSISPPKNQ